MSQPEDAPDIPLPCIISVAGLKKSGKTTVVEALLSELRSRGKRVSSIKTMEHAVLSLDAEGTDTRRHAEAGAEVVVALLGGETVRFQRVTARASIQSISALFPRSTDVIVCEGMADRTARQVVLVCLRTADEWEKTLLARDIAPSSVLAISGVWATGVAPGKVMPAVGIPVFDVTDPVQRSALADVIIKSLPRC